MSYKKILECLWLCLQSIVWPAQSYSQRFYDNHIYDEGIHGIKVALSQAPCAPLVLDLNGNQYFTISFDDLNDQLRDLKYTFIHCTFDWKQPSDLQKSEYLSGFEEGFIQDYQLSMNSLQHYITYSFTFPNEEMRPLVSGNYLLCVYEDESQPLFTYRLMVADEKCTVQPDFQASTNLNEHFTHQEIRFQVQPNNIRLQNPSHNVKVVVMQNMRCDNAMLFDHPYAQKGDLLLYDKPGANTMEGGVEFHRFDMSSLLKTLENIRDIRQTESQYHVYLHPDLDRSYKPYFSEKDINGCFLPLQTEGTSAYQMDYADVHFELRYNKPVEGDIYVFGELTHWRFSEEAKMTYHPVQQVYTTDIYLKTGYYNYVYLYVPPQGQPANFFVEGSHWETENSYVFLVYYHANGTDYDQLIGYKQAFYTE